MLSYDGKGRQRHVALHYHSREKQYEQRVLDINKAAAWNLYSLSKALFCSMEDLLEKTAPEA